ncbi:MAG: cytochrome c, partial [Candidatus Accumulibacter sp.]|nr:cytochrome c [Accumulibacter sp.]
MSERQEAAKSPWKRRFIILFIITVGIPALLVIWLVQRFGGDVPVDYDSPTEHFKYGSTGGEHEMGFPYWIWRVLPDVCPQYLPGKGYRSLGMVFEKNA